MTTPNEELRKQLQQIYKSGELYYRGISDTTDLLQSQAERIAELEDDVEYLQKDIDAMCNAIPSYRWSGGAAELIAKCSAERDTLRAEIAAIAATEPDSYRLYDDATGVSIFYPRVRLPKSIDESWEIRPLFTRPMPAQGVDAELVAHPALVLVTRSDFLIANIKESIECDDLDGASATLEMLRACKNELANGWCDALDALANAKGAK